MVNQDPSDLDRLFGRLAAEARDRPDPVEHPSPETLFSYHEKELSSGEEARIQEHLAICRSCTELLLSYAEFLHPGITEPVGKEEEEESPVPVRRIVFAIAAVLLVTAAGLSLYRVAHGPERFQTLERRGSHRSGRETLESVQLPVTLLLRSPVKVPYPEYRAEIRDRKGRQAQEVSPLRENRSFELEVPLGKRDLEPGVYLIVLYGLKDGKSTLVGRYDFQVTHP